MNRSSKAVKSVSFGASGTFYIKYHDGCSEWGGKIPAEVVGILRGRGTTVDCLWLGLRGAYYLGYNSTWKFNANFPPSLVGIIKSKRVKELMFEENNECYIVQYSLRGKKDLEKII